MVSRTVWLVFLAGVSMCTALHNLFSVDIGLLDEEPFLPNERNAFDDCHMRYLRYGRNEVQEQKPLPEYEQSREYNHVVSIGWTRSNGAIDWACTGTLIWSNFVLTSAHCTTDEGGNMMPPDVVKLGESNEKYIQRRQIAEVIPHPEFSSQTGQNDLALLQLDRSIIVNETVTPSCLWLAPDTVFPEMETLVPNTSAIPAAFTTVAAFQTNPETCGDAQESRICTETEGCVNAPPGSPLQVRLLHNFVKSPFLVGIKAGPRRTGTSCQSAATSYTRIGNYAPWIMQVLQERKATATPNNFIPAACGLDYVAMRPRVDELLLERNGEIPLFGVNVEGQHERDLTYIVWFQWPAGAQSARPDCGGTFVDQSTVLTLADCVTNGTDSVKPTAVLHANRYGNTSIPIKSVTVHPGHVAGSQRNNLAVVKLEKPDNVAPACIWPFDKLPHSRAELAGVGLSTLNNFLRNLNDREATPFPSHVLHAVDTLPLSDCVKELGRFNQTIADMNSSGLVCLRNEQWALPGLCRLLPGGPVQRYIDRAGTYLKYVYALSIDGPTCGYGLPAMAILLEPHIPWLRSVIMDAGGVAGSSNAPSDSVIVINPDLKRSDECSNGDGTVGICVPHEMCLSTPERLRKGERVTLCSVGSIVCCPWGDIARNGGQNPVRVELDGCEARTKPFREARLKLVQENVTDVDNLPHVAEIGWMQNGRIQFNCLGYLITANTILTSAQCAEWHLYRPTVARIGALNAEDASRYILQPIRRVTVHEQYDDVTGANNLALIHLTAPITPSAHYFPGCLYTNSTHVPVRQFLMRYDARGGTVQYNSVFPLYGRDCRERLDGQPLTSGQLCYLRHTAEGKFHSSPPCLSKGDLMGWTHTDPAKGYEIDYLVGIFSHGECREVDDVQVASRVSAFYDWIVENVK